jgi:hypothetical protein
MENLLNGCLFGSGTDLLLDDADQNDNHCDDRGNEAARGTDHPEFCEVGKEP